MVQTQPQSGWVFFLIYRNRAKQSSDPALTLRNLHTAVACRFVDAA